MKKSLNVFRVLIFLLVSSEVLSQNLERVYSIPVSAGGDLLENAWAGGLNSCQISRIDANLDGKKDLFVFDRIGSRISIFINLDDTPGAISYAYTRAYNAAFPTNLRNWVLLRDMNCDGKEDICANSGSGFKIYWNTSGDQLSFTQDGGANVTAFYNWGDSSFESGIYCISPDIPAINDYDNDGDMDFWSWNEFSTALFFYKNMAVENGDCTVPDFECRNRCYGMFGESPDAFDVYLGEDFTCDFNVVNPREDGPMRHTGGTTLAVDLDNNGLKDLVIGDVTESNLGAILMVESSDGQDSASVAHFDFPATFSNTLAAEMTTFPGAFYEDVNNDGVNDLLVSPNNSAECEDSRSVLLYLNTGSNSLPVFEFQQADFLQSQMIDLGTSAYPVLADISGDGLLDLVVANRKYFEFGTPNTSILRYYRNNGTATAPAFELVDDNWLNIPLQGWASVYPAFGDLDNDGDTDLVLGDQDGLLHYYTNSAAAGTEAVFTYSGAEIETSDALPIDVGQNATPVLIDFDGDDRLDLMIGEMNGNVNYYQNVGSPESYSYEHVADTVGNVTATSLLGIQGKSVPFFFRNAQGNWDMLLGSETGQINHYTDLEGNFEGSFTLVTNDYEGIREGERSAVSMGDINGDALPDLVVGNVAGGLGLYLHLPVNIDEDYPGAEVRLYPNPFRDELAVQVSEKVVYPLHYSLYDITGRLSQSGLLYSPGQRIQAPALAAGLYTLRLSGANLQRAVQVVKQAE